MAFLQPSPIVREPFLRAPASVLGLIAVLVAAHLARTLVPADLSNAILDNYAFIPARYSAAFLAANHANPGNLLAQAAPFVTYMFIHADFTHLGVNCIWLLAFGPVVARRYGAVNFLAFFIICGVAAAAVHLACNWGSAEAVIGASGGISGLMAAAIRMFPLPPQGEARRPLAALTSRQVLIFCALWFVVNLVFGLTGIGVGSGIRLIAWQAHIGGFLTGLLLAGPFDRLPRWTAVGRA